MAARTWFAIVALCGVVAAASWGYTQQRRDPTITAQDFVEIQQLLWRNHQGFDFANRDNGEMWVSTFTPDAELDSPGPGRVIVGEKAIRQAALDYFKDDPQRRIRHWTSTFLVAPTPEGATLTAFWMITTSSGGGPLRLGGTGRYESTLVKTDDGWRLKRRVAISEGSLGAS